MQATEIITKMTIADFRKLVKKNYPETKISIRTISFVDLARNSRKCLRIDDTTPAAARNQINEWAAEAGVIPDNSFYPEP